MEQIIDSVFDIRRRQAGSEALVAQAPYFILMALLQPFNRKIHLFIPGKILIELQTVSVRKFFQQALSFFCFPVFVYMLHTLPYGFLRQLQAFFLFPYFLFFILQHNQCMLQILAVQIGLHLFHGKAQLQ